MITRINQQNKALLLSGIALCGFLDISGSYADDSSIVQIIEPETKNQLWINPGIFSYHFQQDKNFNSGNWGAGLEYRFNTVASVTAGRFYNSDRAYSNYAGLYYQPILAPSKLAPCLAALMATHKPIMAAGLQQHCPPLHGKVIWLAPMYL